MIWNILEKKNILHLSGFKFQIVQSLASEHWIGFKSHSDHPFRMWTRKYSKFMFVHTGSTDTHLCSCTSPTLDGKWPSDLIFDLFSPFITFMASTARNQTSRSFAYRIQISLWQICELTFELKSHVNFKLCCVNSLFPWEFQFILTNKNYIMPPKRTG